MVPELDEYREKRDLERSGEPPPGVVVGTGPLVFVVQKHRARRLHYDFRLELDGVLKSWAVPKGPSLDPDEKRLAAMVEDHPIDYGSFEGVIPQGEYGAGEVIVWDRGTYSPDEGGEFLFDRRGEAESRIRDGLKRGKLSFFLRGDKLRGSWTLVRTRRSDRDWLLIKHRDELARSGVDVLSGDRSVLSGRTIEEVKAGVRPPQETASVEPVESHGGRAGALPRFCPSHAGVHC